jgi:hypothetical protein
MIEPWLTPWSKLIYTHLHSEPFLPESDWSIPEVGPLSGANGALPWILFERDKGILGALYPGWTIKVELMMPFSYLLSGGVSKRSLVPGWAYNFVRTIEKKINQRRWAMFALIEIKIK